MRRVLVFVTLFFLTTGSFHASTPRDIQISMIMTGSYVTRDLSNNPGDKWLGLFYTDRGTLSKTVPVQIERTGDRAEISCDYPEGVPPNQPFVFLIAADKKLKEGLLETAHQGSYLSFKKGTPIKRLEMRRGTYELGWKEIKSGDSGNNQLVLSFESREFVLATYPTIPQHEEDAPAIYWAGDLNGDGFLDLIIDSEDQGEVCGRADLFLSSTVGSMLRSVGGFEFCGD